MALRRTITVLGMLSVLALAGRAEAQDASQPKEPAPPASDAPPTPPPPPVRARDATDTVYLLNGGLYRGRIVEIIPDDHVTLIVAGSGEKKEVLWKDISRIVADARPRSATARTAPPPTTSPHDEPPRPPVRPQEPSWRPHPPTFITGAIAFGLSYGLTLLVATPSVLNATERFLDGRSSIRGGGVVLIVPFAGPLLFAGNHPKDSVLNSSGRELSDSFRDMLIVSGVVQIVGGLAMVTGLVLGGKPEPARTGAPKLQVMPLVGQGTVGLSVGAFSW